MLAVKRLQKSADDFILLIEANTVSSAEHEKLVEEVNEVIATTIPSVQQYIQEKSHDVWVRRAQAQVHQDVIRCQAMLDTLSTRLKAIKSQRGSPRSGTRGRQVLSMIFRRIWWAFICERQVKKIRKEIHKCRTRIDSTILKCMARRSERDQDPTQRIELHQLYITDFFGGYFSLPWDMCRQYQVSNTVASFLIQVIESAQDFFTLLHMKFSRGPAEEVIRLRQFEILKEGGTQRIDAGAWTAFLKPGRRLQLSVFVRTSMALFDCLRCQQRTTTILGDNGWITCIGCGAEHQEKSNKAVGKSREKGRESGAMARP